MKTLTIGIVGAAGNVGTHMSAFFCNSIKRLKADKWNKLSPAQLSGHYADKLVDVDLFETVILNAMNKKYGYAASIKEIDINLILFLNGNSESSKRFNQSDGIGFLPISEEQDNFHILIPKSDFPLLGITVVHSIMDFPPRLCDLVITTVTEDAILNEKFIRQLAKIVTTEGYIAISLNGLPPYFLHLLDERFSSIDFQMNKTIPAPPEYPNSVNVTETLGGPEKLIGVVLTVADTTQTIESGGKKFHVSCASKSLKVTHLHSQQIENYFPLSSSPKQRLGNNFFYYLGIASGLNTHRPTDFLVFILQKLQVNFILNPISAIYPVRISVLLANDSIKELIKILNEQFIKMVHMLNCQDHALLKGDALIKRLEQSNSHVASTGQKSSQFRKIEYFNLSAFLHLIKTIAHIEGKKTTNLQETIDLYRLFEKIHSVLNQTGKTEEAIDRIKSEISNLKEQFTQLAKEAHFTTVTPYNTQQFDIDHTVKSMNVALRGYLMVGIGNVDLALAQLETCHRNLSFFLAEKQALPSDIADKIREQHERLQRITHSFSEISPQKKEHHDSIKRYSKL